ncbi:MAG: hypothetical protein EA379_12545 [Phycisphaerales bacterium]|nr:MAG: hypothetical protein EA379_12545 [Phycisphaerales bacterium]
MARTSITARALVAAATAAVGAATVNAHTLTGNPAADGWQFAGHSLQAGNYSRGSANLGFNMYTTSFTVNDSSAFSLAGHDGAAYDGYYKIPSPSNQWDTTSARTWDVGHTVIGYGGSFADIAAAAAGWAAFSGGGVNDLLANGESRLRLQAKFGTSAATWTTSTVAPGSGDGGASTSDGGPGTVFVRSSGWLNINSNVWQDYSGQMMGLQEPGHILRSGGTPGVDAARLIWEYDADAGIPISWQILLNTTLLEQDAPIGYAGLTPMVGDLVVGSVQVANGPFTDALAMLETTIIPLPTPAMLGLAGLTGVIALRRRRGL